MAEILAFVEHRASWMQDRQRLTERFEAAIGHDAERLPAGTSELHDVGWSCQRGGASVEVWIARGGWGVSVEGSSREGLRVAAWFRSEVPADVPVRLSDSTYSFDRALEADEPLADLEAWYEDEVGELF